MVRRHARYGFDQRPGADDDGLVVAALRVLSGSARPAAAHALTELLEGRGLRDAARTLDDLIARE